MADDCVVETIACELRMPYIESLGNRCCGCGACAASCPRDCVAMRPDAYGFPRPHVDSSACTRCGACDHVCPALGERKEDECFSARWAKATDESLLTMSSSGGMFGLLARSVLLSGGIVVGAAWDDGFRSVSHAAVSDAEGLEALLRSKYVQSSVGRDVYSDVRGALSAGRNVLFSGTACQVAGLRSFLGRLAASKRLLTVEVVCHGVPSPLLWQKWLDHKGRSHGSPVRGVNFRSKATGWADYSVEYVYEDGSELVPHGDDWYMRAFLSNASLRGSCLTCPFKRRCGSDVTLGDYWGIERAHPGVQAGAGVSAVLCNTSRGVNALDALANVLEYGESTFRDVLSGNPSLAVPSEANALRDQFTSDMIKMDIAELAGRYPFQTHRHLRVWHLVKRVVHRALSSLR